MKPEISAALFTAAAAGGDTDDQNGLHLARDIILEFAIFCS